MAKMKVRTYSRYTMRAINLLGTLIKSNRIEKRIKARELAERAGISRDLLYRIEKGDPRVELGAALEVAAIVGVPLFSADMTEIEERSRQATEKLTLLPRAVRNRQIKVNDDF